MKLKPEFENNKDAQGLAEALKWAFHHGDTHSGAGMCRVLAKLQFGVDPILEKYYSGPPSEMMDAEHKRMARAAISACNAAQQHPYRFFQDEAEAKSMFGKIRAYLLRDRADEIVPRIPADMPSCSGKKLDALRQRPGSSGNGPSGRPGM